jgi:hypothetical protein
MVNRVPAVVRIFAWSLTSYVGCLTVLTSYFSVPLVLLFGYKWHEQGILTTHRATLLVVISVGFGMAGSTCAWFLLIKPLMMGRSNKAT